QSIRLIIVNMFNYTNFKKNQMHHPAAFLIPLLTLLMVACDSGESPQGKSAGSMELPPNNLVDAPEIVNPLFAPNQGVLRGVDFSSTKTEVKASEKAELLKEEGSSLLYTLDLNPIDFADITYTFGPTNLDRIIVDIYTENLESAANYQELLESFFNAKYKDRTELWDGAEEGALFTANIINADDEESPGLVLIWEEVAEE
ncbi:MAG: hypothetical protein KDC44_20360, partial [Phaeodactylibacter sp.]|nr:hypothetical protein [Phaeodactylibacter sp.]